MREPLRRLFHAGVAAALPGGQRIVPILASVEGFLFPHEAVFLHRLARSAPGEGSVLEIGSYCGLSALCLARGARGRADPRVTTVDPLLRGTEARLRANLRRFDAAGQVELIVAPSLEAAARWSRPLRIVFVDGDHEAESVRADYDAWLPFVEPGGFLLLHDSTAISRRPGPMELARERLRPGALYESTGTVGSITWARRCGGAMAFRPTAWGRRPLDTLFDALQRRNAPTGPRIG